MRHQSCRGGGNVPAFPQAHLILIESGGDISPRPSPGIGGHHALRHRCFGRRENTRARPGRHHALGPLDHQQDPILAPMVGASLAVMDADTKRMRGTRPYCFAK